MFPIKANQQKVASTRTLTGLHFSRCMHSQVTCSKLLGLVLLIAGPPKQSHTCGAKGRAGHHESKQLTRKKQNNEKNTNWPRHSYFTSLGVTGLVHCGACLKHLSKNFRDRERREKRHTENEEVNYAQRLPNGSHPGLSEPNSGKTWKKKTKSKT